MRHMKQSWDIMYLEFSDLLDKNLLNQGSRTIKNKIVKETGLAADSKTDLNSHIC